MPGSIANGASPARTALTPLEDELKELIVKTLVLDDVTPEQIASDAPLFGEGLGLDSIDMLELAMALHKRYGVKTRADDERNQEIFASVRTLARFVAEARSGSGA
jgi:acyl carrier protein